MAEMDSGLFRLNGGAIDSFDHVSRLSIRWVLGGTQYYRLGGSHHHRIDPTSYLLIAHGQSYATALPDPKSVMVGVAFRPSLVKNVLQVAVRKDEDLIDTEHDGTGELPLVDRRFDCATEMAELRSRVVTTIDEGRAGMEEREALVIRLLELIVRDHGHYMHRADRLVARRASTRVELLRRLSMGRDYMDAFFHRPLSLREIAREACMSEYHFLRAFRDAFGESPFAYLGRRRMQEAERLLAQTNRSVSDIALMVGFDNVSAFSRRFRNIMGQTPTQSRVLHR